MMVAAVWIAIIGYGAIYAGLVTLAGIGKGQQPYSVFDALTKCDAPQVAATAASPAPSAATAPPGTTPEPVPATVVGLTPDVAPSPVPRGYLVDVTGPAQSPGMRIRLPVYPTPPAIKLPRLPGPPLPLGWA